MIYMLDTDTLVFMIRGLKAGVRHRSRRQRALRLVGRCRDTQATGGAVTVSAITVSELEFAAHHGGNHKQEIAAVRKVLLPFEQLDYNSQRCAVAYGRIRHELESAGQPIGGMDLLIAAHAVSLNATLVTNNISHFRRVKGLATVNWSRA